MFSEFKTEGDSGAKIVEREKDCRRKWYKTHHSVKGGGKWCLQLNML